MRVKGDTWSAHLQRSLPAVAAIFSDEILLREEALADYLKAADTQGFSARERLYQQDEPWERLRDERDALTLFAEKRCLILQLDQLKLSRTATNALAHWLAAPAEMARLCLVGPRPDAGQQKSAWFRDLEKHATVLILYPPNAQEWPQWVGLRLQQAGLEADDSAQHLLCELTAGNLLACQQAILRLREFAGTRIDAATVRELLADDSRFTVFELADAALRGEMERIDHILDRLRGGDAEPVLLLWALHRDLRLLLRLQSEDVTTLCREERLFPPRSQWLRRAAARIPARTLWEALASCAAIDARIKGQDPSPPWPALGTLALRIAAARP